MTTKEKLELLWKYLLLLVIAVSLFDFPENLILQRWENTLNMENIACLFIKIMITI